MSAVVDERPAFVVSEPGVYDGMPTAVLERHARVAVGRAHAALVDAADLALVEGHRWHLLRGHNGKLYAYASGTLYMHRLIAGTQPGYETDHINGDGLDNRRSNLRSATASQNRANMGKPRRPRGATPSSAYKGVSWDRSRGRWQAKIQVAGQHRNLGRYDDEAQAARAYDAAAVAAWGDFAAVNFATAAAA